MYTLALSMGNRSAMHFGINVASIRDRQALIRRDSCSLRYDGQR
jgi:hypothetical protein